MLLTVRNLGPIKEAVIDLSKKFTLFCGLNSTGKTYLSYIVYSLFVVNEFSELKFVKKAQESIVNNGYYTITKEDIDEYIVIKIKDIKDNLSSILGIPDDLSKNAFSEFDMELSLSDNDYQQIMDKQFNYKLGNLIVQKEQKSSNILFSNNTLLDFQWHIILCSLIIGNAIMSPVERNSVYTFKSELSVNRIALVNALASQKTNLTSTQALLNTIQRYPNVINDVLMTAGDLISIKNYNSDLAKIAEEIENDILRGSISISNENDVDFKCNGKISLPIVSASSLVKTLSSLIIDIKHRCNYGSRLMIDEPEMNLHPSNQVLLAPIFAKVANNGVNMVISSHSDYFIREINNLIVAKSLKDKGDDAYKQYYQEDSLLDYKDVQVLYFDFDKDGLVNIKSLDVDEYGFAVDSIDETINQQNQRMMDLFGRMNESDNSNDVEND